MVTYNFANEGLRAQKTTNFLAGFVLALAALFVALEYTQREVKIVDEDIIYDYKVEEDMIPLTFHQEAVPAPPPAAAPTVAEIINEVQDDIVLPENEIITFNDALANADKIGDGSGVDEKGTGTIFATDAPIREPIEIVTFPDTPAEFPGDINKWLSQNLRYPAICQEQGVQGRVIVSFVVKIDGSIDSIRIRHSPDNNLTNEALRVVNLMPKWTPALKDNKYVPSYFTLPILFRLN